MIRIGGLQLGLIAPFLFACFSVGPLCSPGLPTCPSGAPHNAWESTLDFDLTCADLSCARGDALVSRVDALLPGDHALSIAAGTTTLHWEVGGAGSGRMIAMNARCEGATLSANEVAVAADAVWSRWANELVAPNGTVIPDDMRHDDPTFFNLTLIVRGAGHCEVDRVRLVRTGLYCMPDLSPYSGNTTDVQDVMDVAGDLPEDRFFVDVLDVPDSQDLSVTLDASETSDAESDLPSDEDATDVTADDAIVDAMDASASDDAMDP